MKDNIKILGTGFCLPNKKINNDYFYDLNKKDDAFIYEKTGIKSRYIINDLDEYNNIIIRACKQALKKSFLEQSKIDLVIMASSTPLNLFGGVSKIVNELNINNVLSFDITLACNGFNTAMYTASQFIKDNNFNYALVIGCDCLSRWIDMTDYKTSILFGDGAGAIVIGKEKEEGFGILDYYFTNNHSKNDILKIGTIENEYRISNKIIKNNKYNFMEMNGKEVFKYVINELPLFISDSLIKSNISINDIKYIIPHQANQNILNIVAEKLNISKNKILSNIEKYGNTSAASIPILLHETLDKKLINKDDIIMFLGFGAGMSSSIIIYKYH